MTALADIGTRRGVSKAMLAVAALKGSDLEEFNATHPRDEGGRFARAGSAPQAKDPRMERRGRRLRRQRTRSRAAVRAAKVEEAEKPKEEEEKKTLSSLAALHRPRRSDLNTRNAKAKPKGKEAVSLNDKEYLKQPLPAHKASDRFIIVTRAEAKEFAMSGSLVTGAARDRWKNQMLAATESSAREDVSRKFQRMAGDGMVLDHVALYLPHSFHVEERPIGGYGDLTISGAHVLEPSGRPWRTDDPEERLESLFTAHDRLDLDEIAWVPIITVQAHTEGDYKQMMRGSDADIMKSAAWEAEEHPRDPRSGRFAAAGGGEIDPRIAREQRRRRRRRRSAAMDLRARAHEPSAAEREEAAQEEERERRYAERPRRSDLNPRPRRRLREVGRPHGGKEEPPPKPRRKPGIIEYGDIGAGGRILTQEEWRAARRRTESVRTSSAGPIPVVDFLPKKTKTKPVEVEETFGGSMKETQAPVELIWENGEPTNLAEFQAYHAALKAARARKRKASPS